jgi:hypothetical protein
VQEGTRGELTSGSWLLMHVGSRATVAQIAEKLNVAHDRKVSDHTVHRSLRCMGLRSSRR